MNTDAGRTLLWGAAILQGRTSYKGQTGWQLNRYMYIEGKKLLTVRVSFSSPFSTAQFCWHVSFPPPFRDRRLAGRYSYKPTSEVTFCTIFKNCKKILIVTISQFCLLCQEILHNKGILLLQFKSISFLRLHGVVWSWLELALKGLTGIWKFLSILFTKLQKLQTPQPLIRSN